MGENSSLRIHRSAAIVTGRRLTFQLLRVIVLR